MVHQEASAKKVISGFSSPLRYPGGKTRLASKLLEVIEANCTKKSEVTLVEPYAGGAGVSLSLLFSEQVKGILINDLDRAIAAFWRVAVDDADYLINKIRRTRITVEEWRKQRRIFLDTKSIRKLAFATLFLNRTNRSGIMNGGPIGGLDQSGKWKIDARFTKGTIIRRLQKIQEYRDRIEVSSLEGMMLLKELEQRADKDWYFIFLDPPYFLKGRSLYMNHYSHASHEDLSQLLRKSPLKKWVMTYDNASHIAQLYSDMNIREFAIRYNARTVRMGKELMITPAQSLV